MTTVAATTPYAWPYDAAFTAVRTALLVVRTQGAPPVPAAVVDLATRLQDDGGTVVQVATAPPRHSPTARPPGAVGEAGPPDPPVPGLAADHHVAATGTDGFFGSPLDAVLRRAGCDQLLLAGAWLETSVHSTLRSANDRGYECLLLLDGCVPHDPALVPAARSQIEMSGGIFGAVGSLADVAAALA
ncbi:isochorismatase family protein [Nocardioides sp.]|uniref:isochorismatase family protein n=1 Tax=Nocardioides sp. TaxID=35761 RepID=UPI0035142963